MKRSAVALALLIAVVIAGLRGSAHVEAIAEVFNLLNAKNPAFTITNHGRLQGNGKPNPAFMQPIAYAGDFQQPEQRVGQVGLRVSF